MKVHINCTGETELPVQTLEEFQGNLKYLSEESYKKLRDNIEYHGFTSPVLLWRNPEGKNMILDGHQRLRVVRSMIDEGYECDPIPVCFVDAENEYRAKNILLSFVSQYGKVESQGLYEFIHNNEIDVNTMFDNFSIPGIEPDSFMAEYFADLVTANNDNGDDESVYTKKIEPPIYEPTGECPPITELFDCAKTVKLVDDIDNANIPLDVKEFLRRAAQRHVVFNYQNIAEYYAHSSPEVQDLMERSALVIIDLDKAIENGYVRLSQELAEAYGASGGIDEE